LLVFIASVALVAAQGKWFDYVFIMQFENHSEDEVLADPNFTKFGKLGRQMLNYFAITHPSQPNYIAQVAGDTLGVADDGVHDLNFRNLADLMDAKSVSWKLYMEDYPGNCRTDAVIGKYVRKHNPLISFVNVHSNSTRCARIVNATELDSDLAKGKLSQFNYYTPNMDNDGHDTSVAFAGKYLNEFLTPRLSKFPPKTLVVITWDEDDHTQANQILTILLDPQGKLIAPGGSDRTKYTHYSLLRTVEENFALGNMGRNDATAIPIAI